MLRQIDNTGSGLEAASPERRKPAGGERFCRILGAEDEGELDHSRPVPWDWPELPRRAA